MAAPLRAWVATKRARATVLAVCGSANARGGPAGDACELVVEFVDGRRDLTVVSLKRVA